MEFIFNLAGEFVAVIDGDATVFVHKLNPFAKPRFFIVPLHEQRVQHIGVNDICQGPHQTRFTTVESAHCPDDGDIRGVI